jgi:hypothetical protein
MIVAVRPRRADYAQRFVTQVPERKETKVDCNLELGL